MGADAGHAISRQINADAVVAVIRADEPHALLQSGDLLIGGAIFRDSANIDQRAAFGLHGIHRIAVSDVDAQYADRDERGGPGERNQASGAASHQAKHRYDSTQSQADAANPQREHTGHRFDG